MSLIQVNELIDWARSHGAHLHKQVEVYDDTQYGIGLRVRVSEGSGSGALPPTSRIVSCPFTLSLSCLNALNKFTTLQSYSLQFPRELIDTLEYHVVGHFFLIQQYLNVETSNWGPYIRSLPQPGEHKRLGTPLYFEESDMVWIRGTDLEQARHQREQSWVSDWCNGRRILDSAPGWENWKGRWTWDLYKWAATIFSSRSFVSTLIPEEILSTDEMISPFPVLFPLIDLANHSPDARVTWFTDANINARNISIITEVEIPQGKQVFNNYALKSNAELLMGYGFCIPGNDEVAIAFKPLTEDLVAVQSLHRRRTSCDCTDEGRHVFNIRRTYYRRLLNDGRLVDFKMFENGCIGILAVLLANQREKWFMTENPYHCPEKCSETVFAGPLARNILNIMSILLEKLEIQLGKIMSAGDSIGVPKGSMQNAAAIYRQGQIDTYRAAIHPLQVRLKAVVSQHTVCGHERKGYENPGHFDNMQSNIELITLDCAFEWLKKCHPSIHDHAINTVAQELESPLNPHLDWAELVPDWDFTLWCLWLYIVLQLHASDKINLASSSERVFTNWIGHMLEFYNPVSQPASSSPTLQGFQGDKDEQSTLHTMINSISVTINQSFQPIGSQERADGTVYGYTEGVNEALMNLASTIAAEETFMLDVDIQTEGQLRQGRESLRQRVLCFSKFGTENSSRWKDWTKSLKKDHS